MLFLPALSRLFHRLGLTSALFLLPAIASAYDPGAYCQTPYPPKEYHVSNSQGAAYALCNAHVNVIGVPTGTTDFYRCTHPPVGGGVMGTQNLETGLNALIPDSLERLKIRGRYQMKVYCANSQTDRVVASYYWYAPVGVDTANPQVLESPTKAGALEACQADIPYLTSGWTGNPHENAAPSNVRCEDMPELFRYRLKFDQENQANATFWIEYGYPDEPICEDPEALNFEEPGTCEYEESGCVAIEPTFNSPGSDGSAGPLTPYTDANWGPQPPQAACNVLACTYNRHFLHQYYATAASDCPPSAGTSTSSPSGYVCTPGGIPYQITEFPAANYTPGTYNARRYFAYSTDYAPFTITVGDFPQCNQPPSDPVPITGSCGAPVDCTGAQDPFTCAQVQATQNMHCQLTGGEYSGDYEFSTTGGTCYDGTASANCVGDTAFCSLRLLAWEQKCATELASARADASAAQAEFIANGIRATLSSIGSASSSINSNTQQAVALLQQIADGQGTGTGGDVNVNVNTDDLETAIGNLHADASSADGIPDLPTEPSDGSSMWAPGQGTFTDTRWSLGTRACPLVGINASFGPLVLPEWGTTAFCDFFSYVGYLLVLGTGVLCLRMIG